MPNLWREKSGGRMVMTVPLIIFMDDISGNISKQWNKHHIVYMSNTLLPREMLEKEFCTRFVSLSPHAKPLELMQGVKDSLKKAASDPIIAYDVKHQDEVMLIPYNLFVAGDNPMQAEECSHGGLKCNYLCHTCKVGGTDAEKKTDEGYTSLFECGQLRTPEDTVAEIKHQIELTKLSGGTKKVNTTVSKTGIWDAATEAIVERLLALGKSLRRQGTAQPALSEDQVRTQLESELDALLGSLSIDDHINPLLGMHGVYIHKDTPTEILHTILLGVVKYFWGQTAFILNKAHLLQTFQTRLDSVNKDGLNSPTLGADYIVRYKGGLIGKHFKSLAQVMPYLIYDLVPLLISAQCAPSILTTKAKFHFLLHLPMFIRQFGPAILFSTECYESFNHIFRLTSIYSNHQAPSQDTCQTFAEQDNVKHIITGGSWHDPTTKKWEKAGPGVLEYINEHPHQCKLLGIPDMTSGEVGATRLPTQVNEKGRREMVPTIEWQHTQAAYNLFHVVKSFVAREGDKISLGHHAILTHTGSYHLSKVVEILTPIEEHSASHVVFSFLDFLPEPYPHLRVPCGSSSSIYLILELILLQDVICAANVQHDCMTANCKSTRAVLERQEHLLMTRTKDLMDHAPANAYILNTYALHNYWWISNAVLPSLPHFFQPRLA
ncbi:hypothetical protein BDN67DRAFT_992780 [Paxillus ammoniavirescens]|nr:hypothetical protein BDN67DRAFT_992780 [Paxillus ammoniavirescens]